jgi:hypothetical protein
MVSLLPKARTCEDNIIFSMTYSGIIFEAKNFNRVLNVLKVSPEYMCKCVCCLQESDKFSKECHLHRFSNILLTEKYLLSQFLAGKKNSTF